MDIIDRTVVFEISAVLRDLERSRKTIRKKYRKLRHLQDRTQQQISKTFELLITSLKNLSQIKNESNDTEFSQPKREWKSEHNKHGALFEESDNESDGNYDDAANNTILESSENEMDDTDESHQHT